MNKKEKYLLVSDLEKFYEDMCEDWHLWDEAEKGKYPIQRPLDAMQKFVSHHKNSANENQTTKSNINKDKDI